MAAAGGRPFDHPGRARDAGTGQQADAPVRDLAKDRQTYPVEATSRRSAFFSARSARPKLRITFATGLPVRGCRSLRASCRYDTTVPSLFSRRDSLRYTPAGQAIQAGQHKRHAQNRVPTPFQVSGTLPPL
jgi:hypothetical protein